MKIFTGNNLGCGRSLSAKENLFIIDDCFHIPSYINVFGVGLITIMKRFYFDIDALLSRLVADDSKSCVGKIKDPLFLTIIICHKILIENKKKIALSDRINNF